jgi:hypothetical protein
VPPKVRVGDVARSEDEDPKEKDPGKHPLWVEERSHQCLHDTWDNALT